MGAILGALALVVAAVVTATGLVWQTRRQIAWEREQARVKAEEEHDAISTQQVNHLLDQYRATIDGIHERHLAEVNDMSRANKAEIDRLKVRITRAEERATAAEAHFADCEHELALLRGAK